jgi:hypothetical protein
MNNLTPHHPYPTQSDPSGNYSGWKATVIGKYVRVSDTFSFLVKDRIHYFVTLRIALAL